jgi:putative Holliday junction resolvase
MSRWLAVDLGAKRIGLAVGNTSDRIASPLEVIAAEPARAAIAAIAAAGADYSAQGIVVGWPLNTDGTEGPQGAEARRMAVELARATGLDVRLWDERLSSFAADELLAGRYTRKKKQQRQDAIAAATFLSDFLSQDGPATAPRPGDARP